MNNVTQKLHEHYSKTFELNGANSRGVDWGDDEQKLLVRYKKMSALFLENTIKNDFSLLDVGCGFGGLLEYLLSHGVELDYIGVDIVEGMVEYAKLKQPSAKFICADILDFDLTRKFDFVICNGILTQKLDVPGLQMDRFAQKLIKKMFDLCEKGIAFNVMSTKVNFFSNNLYYRNPAELLSWCMSEITPYVKLDHSYPLYEYTLYLYRDSQ